MNNPTLKTLIKKYIGARPHAWEINKISMDDAMLFYVLNELQQKHLGGECLISTAIHEDRMAKMSLAQTRRKAYIRKWEELEKKPYPKFNDLRDLSWVFPDFIEDKNLLVKEIRRL